MHTTRERIAGNAYANDRDYDRLSGQLVHTSSTMHYDRKLKAWIKRTVEYIDIGRSDPVTPADPDVLLNEVYEPSARSKPLGETELLLERIEHELQDMPLTKAELCLRLDITASRLRGILDRYRSRVPMVGRDEDHNGLYGLAGREYKPCG